MSPWPGCLRFLRNKEHTSCLVPARIVGPTNVASSVLRILFFWFVVKDQKVIQSLSVRQLVESSQPIVAFLAAIRYPCLAHNSSDVFTGGFPKIAAFNHTYNWKPRHTISLIVRTLTMHVMFNCRLIELPCECSECSALLAPRAQTISCTHSWWHICSCRGTGSLSRTPILWSGHSLPALWMRMPPGAASRQAVTSCGSVHQRTAQHQEGLPQWEQPLARQLENLSYETIHKVWYLPWTWFTGAITLAQQRSRTYIQE